MKPVQEHGGCRPQDRTDIIIVNHGAWNHLERCLHNLGGWRVIVVDNGGPADTLESFRARFPAVCFRSVPNFGFGHACNEGASTSSADVLLFLNPDTIPNNSAVSALAAAVLNESTPSIAAPRLVGVDGKRQKSWDVFPSWVNAIGAFRALQRKSIQEDDGRIAVPWVSGAALAVARETFLGLGGFDRGYFMYSEDVDLCFRAQSVGTQILFMPSVALTHAHGGSSRADEFIRALTKSEVVISRLRFASLHMHTVPRLAYLAVLLVLRIVPVLFTVLLSYVLPLPSWRARRGRIAEVLCAWWTACRGKVVRSPRSLPDHRQGDDHEDHAEDTVH